MNRGAIKFNSNVLKSPVHIKPGNSFDYIKDGNIFSIYFSTVYFNFLKLPIAINSIFRTCLFFCLGK